MEFQRREDLILIIFVLFSLLLHLAGMNLISFKSLIAPEPLKKPVEVEMFSVEERDRNKPMELDLPPTPDEKRDTPAKRLGPSDHVAKKETAPKGDAPEDRVRLAPIPKTLPKPSPKKETVEDKPAKKVRPADLVRPQKETARPLPDLKSLLELPQATVDRIHTESRRKEREGVEEGDVVWLDTEKDILISFFRRFRDSIYRVWNYPSASIKRGEQGTCRLEITVDRTGRVRNTNVLISSGFPELDRAARAAVYGGSPYGDLPNEYKKEKLHIIANFEYQLTGKFISRWGYSNR
ncbi:MAG: energy transducer TonB [Deltaproteobacteria bacterium]|nr:energy transducer TonB [Deltaproteobacteria bacterium]